MDVLLDIRQASTIEDALNYYFRAERIGEIGGDGGNMYKCERCKVKVPAKKKSFIARPPIVLCLQLKRFSLMGGKISKPVQLNRCIDVAQYVKRNNVNGQQQQLPPLKYKLVSMITHVGPSPNCGHYTAIGEAANGQFYQFDDSSVRLISVGQALNTASYVVFYEMTKATKSVWTSQGEHQPRSSAMNGNGPSPSSSKTSSSTVTSSQRPPQKTANLVNNQPKLIPSSNGSTNKLGVKVNSTSSRFSSPSTSKKSISLVPYGDEEDSASDTEALKTLNTNGHNSSSNQKMNNSHFVPRSVTMNAMKRSQDMSCSPTVSASPVPPSSSRPSSSMSNDGSVISSSSGVWKIMDNDSHNPSIHSDNSTGSTSAGWKISEARQSVSESRPMTNGVKKSSSSSSSNSSTPTTAMPSSTNTASSSLTSTPEKRSLGKRSSSMEEYEAELDRGKTKKVKRQSDGSSSSSRSNPFQDHQNRSYSNGHHHPHYNNHYRRPSSNQHSSWNGSGGRNSHHYHHHHRDHSYHASSDRNRGSSSSSSSSSSSGGGFRRSYSSSSLNDRSQDQHRDRHRTHRPGGGGGYNRYHDRGFSSSHRDNYNSDRNRKHGHNRSHYR